MENFIVSARKYRPITFKSVVGQDSITTTLKNAIKNNHLAQAYLFCGPRGVGKTTCARILAKTLNCLNRTEDLEACGECESCLSFKESRSYNIHELDAASNNSVDDIRNLIEQVRIPPQIGKFSIYIIDEVHMLSAQAFNAFLKTLEEPPAHAIFILATTEKHKIIPTILSRCQIFDFNRIQVQDMVNFLSYISSQENVNSEEDALNIISQKADGSMRDALSIYDQIISYSGNVITYQSVIENLNILDYEYYFQLVDCFLSNNIAQSLLIYNDILNNGFDGHNFINGLSSHFRDILVCKDPETIDLLEIGAKIKEKYKEQAQACETDFIFSALDICGESDIKYKVSRNQRLHIEMTLIKLCNLSLKKKAKESVDDVSLELNIQKDKDKAKVDIPVVNPEIYKSIPKEEETNTSTPVIERPVQNKREEIPGTVKKKVSFAKINKKPSFGSFSIKEAIKKEEEKEQTNNGESVQDDKDLPVENFSKEQFEEKWNSFAEKIKDENPRMSASLKALTPLIKDDYSIFLEMQNTDQKTTFDQSFKYDLLVYLKKELNNYNIVIETVVTVEQEDNGKLYTDDDKFKYLVTKNPNLDKLKQEFNLGFE